ncbi:phospholipase [Pseudomonas sp. HMWF021]|uniref:phospholipase n=1 Tax=Pseudomonas sp. HMWF021 TaxID=2056857 RepID=UPI000D38B96A|nr:phospholipase [Pseudomonas sp. HMWF021]PTT32052.1 phospholipase [Pseudomonas sp. HMWF021]
MSNQSYVLNNWMSATPQLDVLTLQEITLPGTHNAGSDWQASYPLFGPPRHWLACQHNSFLAQLRNGARALDIRLTYDANKEGAGKFIMHHDGHRNSRTLGNLVTDIRDFLRENPDEFIILDFHELSGKDFNFTLFSELVRHFLGQCAIPAYNRYLSIGELKQHSSQQRVRICATLHPDLDQDIFNDQVQHEWSGSGLTTSSELKAFIARVLKSPPGIWKPWSLSATGYTALGGPEDLHEYIDVWFDPKQSEWATKCNIVNVDFIEESKIVDFCRTTNLIKANRKQPK